LKRRRNRVADEDLVDDDHVEKFVEAIWLLLLPQNLLILSMKNLLILSMKNLLILISSHCSVSLLHESSAVRVVDLDDVEKNC
jgi:hypothetical protein